MPRHIEKSQSSDMGKASPTVIAEKASQAIHILDRFHLAIAPLEAPAATAKDNASLHGP
jgi:hypothetical protein